jgi:hypothetical protein
MPQKKKTVILPETPGQEEPTWASTKNSSTAVETALRINNDLPEGKHLMDGDFSGPPAAAWQTDYRFKHKLGSFFGSRTASPSYRMPVSSRWR